MAGRCRLPFSAGGTAAAPHPPSRYAEPQKTAAPPARGAPARRGAGGGAGASRGPMAGPRSRSGAGGGEQSAAPPPLPHVTGPPSSCGGRARQRGELSAALLRSAPRTPEGPPPAGGARPGAEGKARAEPARAAPAAGLPVRHGSPCSRRASAPAAMAQPVLAAAGPGRAQSPAAAAPAPGGCGEPRCHAGRPRPVPPPAPQAGAASAQRVTRMHFPSRVSSGAALNWLSCGSLEWTLWSMMGAGRKASPGTRLSLDLLQSLHPYQVLGLRLGPLQALPTWNKSSGHQTGNVSTAEQPVWVSINDVNLSRSPENEQSLMCFQAARRRKLTGNFMKRIVKQCKVTKYLCSGCSKQLQWTSCTSRLLNFSLFAHLQMHTYFPWETIPVV